MPEREEGPIVWNAEQVFLHTLDEIYERISQEPTQWNLVRIAGLLYSLLMDGLYDKANSSHRVRLQFNVGPESPEPPEVVRNALFRYMGGDLRGSWYREGLQRSVNRDAFLAMPLVALNAQEFSVRDVLQSAANAQGGRGHFGPSRDTRLHPLEDFDERHAAMLQQAKGRIEFLPTPGTWVTSSVLTIAIATLDACAPLARIISGATAN